MKNKKNLPANVDSISFGGIVLNKINDTSDRVPQSCLKIELKPQDKKSIAIAYKNNIPCLLVGETGTGKTSAIKELACDLQQGYTRISLSGYTTPDELIGSKSVENGRTYYEHGVLTKAMLEGHICVLDELNAITPDTSFIVHSLLDDERKLMLPNGDVIEPHKNFRLYATINPDYEGTKSLNKAFLDRFGVIINVDIVAPEIEEKILIDRHSLTKKDAKSLVAIAWLNRKAYKERKTSTIISTRSLLQTAELIKEGLDTFDAYVSAVVNKSPIDDQQAFIDFYNIIYKANNKNIDEMPIIISTAEKKAYDDKLKTLEEQKNQAIRELQVLKSTPSDDTKVKKLESELSYAKSVIAALSVEKFGA